MEVVAARSCILFAPLRVLPGLAAFATSASATLWSHSSSRGPHLEISLCQLFHTAHQSMQLARGFLLPSSPWSHLIFFSRSFPVNPEKAVLGEFSTADGHLNSFLP